jgi:general secretion pathway protein C
MLDISLRKLRFINYFLILLVFASALMLIRNIISISLTKSSPRLIDTGNNTAYNLITEKKGITSYSAILEKNPFGPPMKLRPLAPSDSIESGAGSRADLILVGTVVGPESLSYAIFEDRSSPLKQEVVAYGEEVKNYGTLTKVDMSSVEIKQDSDVFTVPLIDIKHDHKKSKALHTGSRDSSLVRKIGERAYLLNRRKVQRALENPGQILTDARLLPNIVNGTQEGFRMFEVKRGGLYESLGLKNGDILLRVNELEISNPEVAIQAMTALKGMDKVSLDIIRNSEKLSMNYQIR